MDQNNDYAIVCKDETTATKVADMFRGRAEGSTAWVPWEVGNSAIRYAEDL